MNKLTGKEIIEILNNNYSKAAFAYENWEEPGIEFTAKEKKLIKASEKRKTELQKLLTEGKRYTTTDPEYQEYMKLLKVKGYLTLKNLGLGKVKKVTQVGGENQGTNWYIVNHFVDHDVYIRLDGYYTSYDGTSFDGEDFFEVKPQEKKITVYELAKDEITEN